MVRQSSYDAAVSAQRRPGKESGDGSLDRRELVRLATLAASSHNTQPWTFTLEERTIVIRPDLARRCPVVDPDDAHLYKSLGCAAENLVHAAAAQQHAAHVRLDRGENTVRIELERSAAMRGGPLFAAIPRRQCTRLPYDGRMIAANARTMLEAAGNGNGVRIILTDQARTREAIIEQVREGDEMQLSDPAFRKELIQWLRFNDASALAAGDGLSGRTAGQPPLPDWLAKGVIGFVLTGKSQARTDETNIRSSPLIAVFVAEKDEPEAWVETGRVFERFALRATALDIRTAFVNQPIEVRKLRPALHGLLGLKNETALLMLRVGYGPRAPFSLRRPIDHVIVAGGGSA